MKKEFSLLLLMVSVTFSDINIVLAQEAHVPPSPAVMSMIKGAQTDVNLYSGKMPQAFC